MRGRCAAGAAASGRFRLSPENPNASPRRRALCATYVQVAPRGEHRDKVAQTERHTPMKR